MNKVDKPWGSYEIIHENSFYKVKKIVIKPEKRISLQYHKHRNEHWYIVQGHSLINLDDESLNLKTGDSIDIKKMQYHRIKNISTAEDLIFIEIQMGEYLGEDDIVRINDDFDRN